VVVDGQAMPVRPAVPEGTAWLLHVAPELVVARTDPDAELSPLAA
jgi:hypothetical protein